MSDFQAWWGRDVRGADLARQVFSVVGSMEHDQTRRYIDYKVWAEMFENRHYTGLNYDDYTRDQSIFNNQQIFNAVAAIVKSITAKVTKNDPRPEILTDQGTYQEQDRAKKLNRFLDGMFSNLSVYPKLRRAFRDACIFGTGVVKLQQTEGRVHIDRVPPHEIMVPHREAYYGYPTQLHHRFRMHASVLKDMFPRRRREIDDAADKLKSRASSGWMSWQPHFDDQELEVVESWHVPSGPDARDGRRVMCIEDVALLDEPWDHETFPFAFVHYEEPLFGFWGIGLVVSLMPLQVHMDFMNEIISESIGITARPIVKVKKTATLSDEQLQDLQLGGIFRVDDMGDVSYETTDAVPPSAITERKELWDKSFEISGESQLNAQSKKPPGLNSAVALREFEDITSDRFSVQFKAFEALVVDVARHLIRLGREAKEQGFDIESKAKGQGHSSRRFIERIRWSEVDMDDDKFDMDMFPVNSLPRSPAGRLAYIQELLEPGLIDRRFALKLLDFPDVRQVTEMENARVNDILRLIDRFLSGEDYEAPDPDFQDLALGKDLMQKAWLEHRYDASDDALEKLRIWVVEAQSWLDQAAQAGAPTMPSNASNPPANGTQGQAPSGAPGPSPGAEEPSGGDDQGGGQAG